MSSMLPRFAVLSLFVLSLSAADTLDVFGHKWSVPAAGDWKIEQSDGVAVLHLAESRGPLPGPRRPIQFALADTPDYEQVTIEADIQPLKRSLIFVFAYRDAAHFDYAHISTDTGVKQPVHNGIFHVYGGERVRISNEQGPPAIAALGRWYHAVLNWDARTGAVDVTIDGKRVPALHAIDVSLGAGKVGLGSFDETALFKNVKITGKTVSARASQ